MEKMHGRIPDDLILNILRRLPGKSLARFKCVCKSWLSSITQLKHHKDKLILYSIFGFYSVDLYPQASDIEGVGLWVPMRNLGSRFITIGSCNGLLCFYTEETMGFVICNPWTGRYKTVSSHIKISSTNDDILYGFGYDHSTDDYMIVRIFRNGFRSMVVIYSRKTDSWLQMGILPKEIKRVSLRYGWKELLIGFFANGALYCHVQYIANKEYYERVGVSYDTTDGGVLNTILCFDLVDRKFSMIVPPVDDEVCKKPVFDLCVFGGNLCMVYYDHNCHTDIWSWEGNDKGNWIKLMSIPCLMRIPYLAPVFLMNNGHELLLKKIIKKKFFSPFADSYFKTKLFFYDQKQKTFREWNIGSRKVITYTKSLVSPARDAGDDHESLIYRPNLSDVDIATQGMFESQLRSTSRVGDYKREVKPKICRHLSSEFGAHCKSSTSRVSLQWTVKLE